MNGKLRINEERINEHRTVMGEDIKSILEGTLHILQLYTDVLNVIAPRTMLIDRDIMENVKL